MKQRFLNFVLDTSKQTLHHGNEALKLSKKNYELLNYLLTHHDRLVTKDEILNHIWDGRVVSENTLNQNISALRKLLSKHEDAQIIRTEFGKGYVFEPDVTEEKNETIVLRKNKQSSRIIFVLAAATLLLIFISLIMEFNNPLKANKQNLTPIALIDTGDKSDWLNTSANGIFNLLASLPEQTNILKLKSNESDKPGFIDNYWRINPSFEVIKTNLQQNDQVYQLDLSVVKKNQTTSEAFTATKLLDVFAAGNQWLVQNSSLDSAQTPLSQLITHDSHTLELYMRGYHDMKQGQFKSAENYTELAINNNPEFYLARLQLAEVKYLKGEHEASLAELETLNLINTPPELKISIDSLRGDVLDTAGRQQEAIEIYQNIIDKTADKKSLKLLDIRYNLSYSLTTSLRYQEALDQLKIIKQSISPTSNTSLYAHVLQKEGSIQLQLGQTEQATQAAKESMRLFTELDDQMSQGKVLGLLARIANHQSDYKTAKEYLIQGVNTYRMAEFPLGIGAMLNELIYAQTNTGELTLAWENMNEMKQIAIEIDYFAMQMAAIEAEFKIALAREQLEMAANLLNLYHQKATSNNFSRGLFKHNIFALNLAIRQQQPDTATPFIAAIQEHINTTQEQRLQPRLDLQKAQIQLLQKNTDDALNLLFATKDAANQSADQETVNLANNILLKHYLKTENWSAMSSLIDQANSNQTTSHEFLLYQSKLQQAQGNLFEAISLAQRSKQKANEFWRSEDAQYLNQLIAQKNK